MGTSVVLITGGLTGIGRAVAVAFAKEGAMVTVAGDVRRPARNSSSNFALSARKLSSSTPTFARKMTFVS